MAGHVPCDRCEDAAASCRAGRLQSNFTILDTDDQLRLLKQLIVAADIDEKRFPARALGGLIDEWKNKGLVPGDIDAGEAERYANGQGAELYRQYQDRLRSVNACDFGDLLLHMLTILKTHRDVLEHYQQRFRYIMVDEYQDTNSVQYLWLRLLAQARKNIACVGDDDQSIYSWRVRRSRISCVSSGTSRVRRSSGWNRITARPRIFWVRRRGSSPIMAGGSARRCGPSWTSARRSGARRVGRPRGSAAGRRGDRAAKRSGTSYGDIAILVRASHQTREFEDRFIAIGLPYRIVGGFRFYERAEIRDALAYLRIVNQPSDDLAFERIVNVPKRGLGDKALTKIHQLARAEGLPLTIASARILDTDELTPQARRSLGNLIGDIARWRDMAGDLAHPELARQLLDESGYTAMYQNEKSAEAAGRLENLSELVRAMEDYESLGAFLEHVSLVMDRDGDQREPEVTIMTIHAAKGWNSTPSSSRAGRRGCSPRNARIDEGGTRSLEEERRLAYVAITRARRKAVILHAANRRIYGQWTSSLPSRFVGELPPEHIDSETSMTGGESLWRANWSEHADPFANVGRGTGRGPGWQRAATGQNSTPARPARIVESRSPSVGMGQKGRDDLTVGERVFHQKFGYVRSRRSKATSWRSISSRPGASG